MLCIAKKDVARYHCKNPSILSHIPISDVRIWKTVLLRINELVLLLLSLFLFQVHLLFECTLFVLCPRCLSTSLSLSPSSACQETFWNVFFIAVLLSAIPTVPFPHFNADWYSLMSLLTSNNWTFFFLSQPLLHLSLSRDLCSVYVESVRSWILFRIVSLMWIFCYNPFRNRLFFLSL